MSTATMTNGNATPEAAACGVSAERSTDSPVFRPHADVIETPGEYQIVMDVPGASADGVELKYERGELSIRAHVPVRKYDGRLVSAEYDMGDYVRTFAVGEKVDTDRIEATLRHGVLTIHLPKVQAAQARKIAVKAG
jgi:HSP20 family protein